MVDLLSRSGFYIGKRSNTDDVPLGGDTSTAKEGVHIKLEDNEKSESAHRNGNNTAQHMVPDFLASLLLQRIQDQCVHMNTISLLRLLQVSPPPESVAPSPIAYF